MFKVLNDANVTEAAKAVVYGAMLHSGQVKCITNRIVVDGLIFFWDLQICMSTERVIAQRGIADQLMAKVKELSEGLKAGDHVNNPSSAHIGPVFTESSAANIIEMIKEAKAEGAEVVLGDVTHKRTIVQPHILSNVKPNMRVWRRETFGPGEMHLG